MPSRPTTVPVCDSCIIVIANGDDSHLDDTPETTSILASLELLREPAIADYVPSASYVRCWLCGDDTIGYYEVSATIADG